MKTSSRNSFLGQLFVILLMMCFLFAVILWWAAPRLHTSMPMVISLSESLSSWPEMKQQEQQQDHQQHQNLVVHKQQERNNVPLLDCKDIE